VGRLTTTFDLRLNPGEWDILVPGLRACSFPFSRIRRKTGAKVPISVADTSRYNQAVKDTAHAHVHDDEGEAHVLADPTRRAALGLYWLPTREHPAGRIEVGTEALSDPHLAREVMLAEVAHAVDYGAITDRQRAKLMGLFEHRHQGHDHPGWFEEHGETAYFAWRGERWMGLFMAAYAPTLPRPLEARQPWHWDYDNRDVTAVRRILRRPGP